MMTPDKPLPSLSAAEAPPSSAQKESSAAPPSVGGDAQEWARRAEWLESEARSHHRDPAARARLLLAASEVRAMSGARDDARRLAVQAASQSAAPAFASRQARALQQLHGDFTSVLKHLAKEGQSLGTDAARAHAHYVTAEILRLIQRDPAGASKSLAAAEQSDPQDYRVTLQRLVAQLAESQKPPDICVRQDDAVRQLRLATGQLRQLRGAEAPRVGPDDENPALPLLETQRALTRGRLSEAADAIDRLQAQGELRSAVSWLSTLWRMSTATPEDALLLLRDLVRKNPGREERRALAARALAAGSWHMLREALSGDVRQAPAGERDTESPSPAGTHAGYPAFSGLERASLMALMAQPADLGALAQGPVEELALKPLATAIARVNALRTDAAVLARDVTALTPIELELNLGRAAARSNSFSALDGSDERPDDGILGLLVRLERSREARDLAALARLLPQLLSGSLARAESSFVAAVFAERAGDLGEASALYESAASSATTREAAVRACGVPDRERAATFRALSAHSNDPLQRAMLLTEALFHLDADAPEFDAVADEAAQTYPGLPFAYQLGEVSARMRGDRVRVARWLARQRDRARGAGDFPLAAIRKALFTAPFDPGAAAHGLEEAIVPGVLDLALRHCLEQTVEREPKESADFRRRVAPLLSPRGRDQYLAEAIVLYEKVGDTESAIATARELGGPVGDVWSEQLAKTPEALEWLSASWSRLAQETRDGALACDLYNRLSRLSHDRGDDEAARAWQRERLKLRPGSLDALRFLEIDAARAGREADLERIAVELFERLGEVDGIAYAFLGTRLKIDRGAFQDARVIVERACAVATPPLWALRLQAVYARDYGDDHTLLAVYRTLRERASQPLDAAILSLRASEAATRLGQAGIAKDEVQRALTLAPGNPVILSARAEVLRRNADFAGAAETFEMLASTTQSKARRLEALYQAGVLWLDTLGDRARGMLALQAAASIDSPHPGLLARLRALYAQSEDFEGLGELIERQSSLPPEHTTSAQVEMARAAALITTGHSAEARGVLSLLLERQPLHAEALNALAELHFAAGEWTSAERAWRRIVEGASRDRWRGIALHALSRLYEAELLDLARAVSVYHQLLEGDPGDLATRQRLVAALNGLGRLDEAVFEQRELLERAPDDDARRQALLALVRLLTQTQSGRREAESLLEQAHRTWPENTEVLEAELNHYKRTGQQGTARVITERATNSARNAILAGRLEPALFQMLDVAARLGGDADIASAARAGLGALLNQPVGMSGAAEQAGRHRFDDLTAPAPLSAGFRRLLYTAGDAIERAYAIDPSSLDPRPADEATSLLVRRMASWFGLDGVRVVVSDQAGADCFCVPSHHLYVVLGQALLEHDNPRVREFLLFRAMKIAQANACALTRMDSGDLWSVVAGFLACFAPPWQAEGADAQRLIAARNKLRPHITASPDSDLIALTSAVAANILPQAAILGAAISSWASRVALFGVGEPSVAIEALWTAGALGPLMPRDVDSRVRWIAINDHARDLVGYGISDAYIEARKRAGLDPHLG